MTWTYAVLFIFMFMQDTFVDEEAKKETNIESKKELAKTTHDMHSNDSQNVNKFLNLYSNDLLSLKILTYKYPLLYLHNTFVGLGANLSLKELPLASSLYFCALFND